METIRFSLTTGMRLTLAAAGFATLVACQTVPETPAALSQARAELRMAESDPAIVAGAPLELQQAREALARAERSRADDGSLEEMNSLAHIAQRRVSIARAVAERKLAEAHVQQADAERERVRAEVRAREAKLARDRSVLAMEQVQQQQQRNRQLEAQLEELHAKRGSRGLVVTLGDVLFDTDRAELRGGALHSIQRLAAVLRDHPDQNIVIEGYTDAQGSESYNLDLAERRAESVRRALLAQGAQPDQIDVRAFGEANPVASNDTTAGRQLNRRVEIVFANSQAAAGSSAPGR